MSATRGTKETEETTRVHTSYVATEHDLSVVTTFRGVARAGRTLRSRLDGEPGRVAGRTKHNTSSMVPTPPSSSAGSLDERVLCDSLAFRAAYDGERKG